MNRGKIQQFLDEAVGTASQVFGEPTQQFAQRGEAAKTEQWAHLRSGVGIGDRVGERRAHPRGVGALHVAPAVDHRSARGR